MLEIPVMDRVSAGRMACTIRSPNVTPDASTPMGTESPMGNTFSHTANTISSTRASQKAGVLAVISA